MKSNSSTFIKLIKIRIGEPITAIDIFESKNFNI